MKNLAGKKLLVLGSNYSTINLIEIAHKHGVYVVVTSHLPGGQAREFADENIFIDIEDHEQIVAYIQKNGIDGVMTGASEHHILNMLQICKKAGLPVYATVEQWDLCQDKRHFKDLCKQYHVPGVPEYPVDCELKESDFPVIVKPIDGCSSRGINICRNSEELKNAKQLAIEASPSKKILIERYIDNGGLTLSIKYVAIDGQLYLEAIGERHVLNNGLITANGYFPSLYLDNFMKNVDPYIKDMFKGIDFKNGVFSLQAIPDGDNIYIYEICLRVTGGMTYKMTESTSGNNSLEMLLHFALTGQMCDEEDIKTIDPNFRGMRASSLTMPLRTGKIAEVSGLNLLASIPNVVDVTHYYEVGDVIEPKHINTLDQLFARIMAIAPNEDELYKTLQSVRNTISVKDADHKEMIIWDTYDRLYQEYLKRKAI